LPDSTFRIAEDVVRATDWISTMEEATHQH